MPICSGKGYTDNHCDGTAPFCNGGCYDGSGDDENQPYWANGTGYIDCPGHCTDGSGCWSGSKQCSCWNSIDCQDLCMHGSANRYNNLFAFDWACELRMSVDLSGCTDCAVRIIGACGWSDDEEGVQSCYCLYGPEDYVPE